MVSTGIVVTMSGLTAEILDVNLSGVDRPAIDVSHQGTTDWREFLMGKLTDPGQLQLDIQYDANTVIPLNGPITNITIVGDDSDSAGDISLSFDGAIQSFSAGLPLEGKATGRIGIKISGAITGL